MLADTIESTVRRIVNETGAELPIHSIVDIARRHSASVQAIFTRECCTIVLDDGSSLCYDI